ncbi:MAG: aminotransferase class IV [Sphingobacterium sp.]|jgi:D-alanine transaminase|nr:aminotransferase class IV [Sphingobacterium sp.]
MKLNYPKQVFVNGEWLTAENAKISIFDRGFLLGDGIYDVVPYYKGKFFRMKDHLDRLANGLSIVGIKFDVNQIIKDLEDALAGAETEDGILYIQITRGIAPRSHSFPSHSKPSVIIYSQPYLFEGFSDRKVDVTLEPDFRWHRCDIKSISLIANVLLNQMGASEGYYETLLNREGLITEGTYTSVFFIKDNKVYTHPNGFHILPGITRKIVLELCEKAEIEFFENAVSVEELDKMDGAFLAGTTAQITEIACIHLAGEQQRKICYQSSPLTKKLQNLFYIATQEA